MNLADYYRANTAIHSLAKEWGTTPEETRRILKQSYANMLKEASPIKRLHYFALMKTTTPTAEEIMLQIADELIPERIQKTPADPLQELSRTWVLFQTLADHENTTPEEVRKSIAEAIDEAYAATDPAARTKWEELFPEGKPTPEAFITRIAQELRERHLR